MPLPAPRSPHFAPFIGLCDAVLLTTAEVARHLKYSEQHLHNMRRADEGIAFVKLPGGAIRYQLSEIIAWQLQGQRGPVTLERVSMALATMPRLGPDVRAAIDAHLAAVFSQGGK